MSAPRGLSGVSRRSLLTGIPAALLRAEERPPNFLVIVADDHGWDDVGCYGHPVVGTPNLDRLASDGVRFTHCFTTAPLCSPGRGAVMSGLYPHVSGVTRLVQGEDADRLSMRPDLWTFAKGLKGLGYETAAARKWHLSTAGPTAHGFDQEFPSRVEYLDQSVAFLERHHARPFCLYFCPTHTHRPYRNHDAFKYGPEDVAQCLPPYLKDTQQVRQHYAWYLSETSKMDDEIGQLLGALDRTGEMDRTVVAYLTDHGPSMHRAKFSLYEWGTHSSLIMRGPGVSGSGRVDTGLASTVDIGPTLMRAGIAGGEAPESFKLIVNHTRQAPLMWPQVIRNWQEKAEDTLSGHRSLAPLGGRIIQGKSWRGRAHVFSDSRSSRTESLGCSTRRKIQADCQPHASSPTYVASGCS